MQKLILLLCLFPITIFGQWEAHIAPGDENIFEMVIANEVIIASSKAGIFRSTNQGDSWEFCFGIGNYNTAIYADGADVYVANKELGLFKSVDQGLSWVTLIDSIPGPSPRAMAASSEYLYIATASNVFRCEKDGSGQIPVELYEFTDYQYNIKLAVHGSVIWVSGAEGLQKSEDHGATWTTVIADEWFTGLDIHGDLIMVGGAHDLYRSYDAGETWTLSDTGFPVGALRWLEDRWFSLRGGVTMRMSTDNGDTWESLMDEVPSFNGSESAVKLGDAILWAGYRCLKTLDYGDSWFSVMGGFDSTPFSNAYWDFVGDYMVIGWQSTNFSDNEGATWFGPLLSYEVQSVAFKKIVSHGDIAIGFTLQDDFYVSDGDFHQWEPFTTNLPEPLNISDMVSVGGKLFMVNHGDNYISEDDGLTWTNIGSVPQFSNYRMLVQGDLIIARSPYVLLFEHLVSSDFGETWTPFEGNGLPPSLSDALLYSTGDLLYLIEDAEIFASTDNGNNFISLTNGALNYPGSDVPNFINDFDANGNNLFVKSFDDIIFSPDHGETWINILDNLPNEDMIGARISAQEDGLYLLYKFSQIPQAALWKRSYIDFALHTSTVDVMLCAGDEYDGVVYNNDAMLTDTLVLPDYDSITITNIIVLPIYEEIVELELEQGALFNNISIHADTVFVENLVASNGCDSTIITEISVLTNTNNWLKQHLNLTLFPNPTDGAFYLKYTLPNATELEISVLDLNGKVVQTLLEKQKNKAGEYTLNVNSHAWASGVYFIYFQIEGANYGVKVERL